MTYCGKELTYMKGMLFMSLIRLSTMHNLPCPLGSSILTLMTATDMRTQMRGVRCPERKGRWVRHVTPFDLGKVTERKRKQK
jgi:hypothetical protein